MSSAVVLKIMARSSTFHFVFVPAPLLAALVCATLLSSSENSFSVMYIIILFFLGVGGIGWRVLLRSLWTLGRGLCRSLTRCLGFLLLRSL